MRWIPFHVEEKDLRNRIKNKMIRPTTIPQSLEELMIEQGIAREALRLAFEQHKSLAVGLKGVQQERTISDTFEQSASGETLVDLTELNMLVGSGGVLSHAPRRAQAAFMLIDGFLPECVTHLAVDSIFMMPQLGVLSEVHPKAATEVFKKDCLIHLGPCVAPIGVGKEGVDCLQVRMKREESAAAQGSGPGAASDSEQTVSVKFGEMKVLQLGVGERAKVTLSPAKGFDVGAGSGKSLQTMIDGGVVGVVVDCRGRRPFQLPATDEERVRKLKEWNAALSVYPERK
jgi:hypothetical protein